MQEDLQEVVLNRSVTDVEVVTDAQNRVHVAPSRDAMKREMVKQLTGFYMLHGIRTLRRTELLQLCSKSYGLLKTDSGWGIHAVEKPIDDLVDEEVVERIQYTEPKKATYIRLTNKYVNDNLK